MLNLGLQTHFLDIPVLNSLIRGANELKIGSSILTRRGGTDANAPESPRKAILQDWHVGILGPKILENLGKVDPKAEKYIEQLSEIGPYPRKWAENLWRRSQIWLRTFSKGSRALNP